MYSGRSSVCRGKRKRTSLDMWTSSVSSLSPSPIWQLQQMKRQRCTSTTATTPALTSRYATFVHHWEINELVLLAFLFINCIFCENMLQSNRYNYNFNNLLTTRFKFLIKLTPIEYALNIDCIVSNALLIRKRVVLVARQVVKV